MRNPTFEVLYDRDRVCRWTYVPARMRTILGGDAFDRAFVRGGLAYLEFASTTFVERFKTTSECPPVSLHVFWTDSDVIARNGFHIDAPILFYGFGSPVCLGPTAAHLISCGQLNAVEAYFMSAFQGRADDCSELRRREHCAMLPEARLTPRQALPNLAHCPVYLTTR